MWEIEYYERENGRVPVEESIDSLAEGLKEEVLDDISALGELGPNIRMPYARNMGDKLWELRVRFFGNHIRVFYFTYS